MSDGGLRKLFSDHLKQAHWQSVETWSTGKGVPDVNYCFPDGIEGWVECKKTETFRLDISPEQVSWAETRMRRGGRVFIGVRRQTTEGPRKGPPVDELWLFKGVAIRWLTYQKMNNTMGLALRCEGGPRNWDWAAVAKVLISNPL